MREKVRHIANNVKLQKDSPVILQCWIKDEDDWIANIFEKALNDRGYKVYTVIMNKTRIENYINNSVLNPWNLYGSDWEKVKNIIDVCQFSPPELMNYFEGDIANSFVGFMRMIFEKFTKQEKCFLQIRVPSKNNIAETRLTLEQYKEYWSSLVFVDYNELELQASKKIDEYKKFRHLEITTKDKDRNNHILKLSLNNRKWHQDVGNGDFPAGEVYIAPIETAVSGSFVATMVTWEEEIFDEVILEFKDGKLIQSSKECIKSNLENTPGDSLMLGEFGVGINTGLKSLTGYRLFDEKIKGTCHIAVGANYMFGGINQTPVHFDFVAKEFTVEGK